MSDETYLHLIASLTGGAFVAFIVHLMLGEDKKPKKRKK